MSDFEQVEKRDGESVSVLHITDTHLFAAEDGTLLGIDTAESLNAVIDAVLSSGRSFDFVLCTGDLSQDYSTGSYERFARIIRRLGKPVYWLPGNHDDGPLMYRIMPGLGISTAREIRCGRWQFLMLNSQVYSAPCGYLAPDQLAFLRERLDRSDGLFSAVCLHHNVFHTESAWLDQHDLKNSDQFKSIIYHHGMVKLVLCGHIHQNLERELGGISYIATPSTSIQFAYGHNDFQLDRMGPGWRFIDFAPDGTFTSDLFRLPAESFSPNWFSGGY